MMSQLILISQRKIDGLIIKTIEKVLMEIFGELPLTYILQGMKEKFNLGVNDAPSEPRAFSRALREILGKNSVIIEDLILENLYLNLEIRYKLEEGYNFSDYIRDLREQS
jgi:hypothetical protein